VVVDDFKGAFIATKHLIEQGYKRIAHISGPSHLKIFNDRLNGYMEALRENKMNVRNDLIYPGDVSIEAGRKGIQHLLKLKNPPDAVFAVEDFTALGAIKELKQHRIKIPKDFGVIGFANEGFGEHITPTLSTIDQQTVQMGKESSRLLLQMINNGDHMVLPAKVVLEPIPIFRESSRRKKELR
jgi:LacI family transcriptional regulator